MSPIPAKPDKPAPKAGHGASSEVNWRTGAGRQPYANQGSDEALEPNFSNEVEAGNRGEYSGNNLEQFEQVKRKP